MALFGDVNTGDTNWECDMSFIPDRVLEHI
jgi:hypothetical protein